jgi:outer membrane scaffolding protein for murein synthesis (MipA/OmpV family)
LRGLRAALIALALVSQAANAEPLPRWELGLGVTAFTLPDYRGSDEKREYVFPFPYVLYRGDFLRVDREGPRAILFETLRAEIDLSFHGTLPVRSGRNRAREGMPDLDPTLEAGPQLTWTLLGNRKSDTRLDLRLPLRIVAAADVDLSHLRHAGYVFHPHLHWTAGRVGGWDLGAEAGVVYASGKYHRHFYSVGAQFAAAERPAYEARGGYSGAVASSGVSRRFGKLWVAAFVRYDSVAGAVFEDSPLVKRVHNAMAGIAIAWVFAASPERVDVRN